jgi:hypothetical protein
VLHHAQVHHHGTADPGWRGDEQLGHRAALDIFHNPQRDVHVAFGPDGEIPHRDAVAHEDNRNEFGAGVAAAK